MAKPTSSTRHREWTEEELEPFLRPVPPWDPTGAVSLWEVFGIAPPADER